MASKEVRAAGQAAARGPRIRAEAETKLQPGAHQELVQGVVAQAVAAVAVVVVDPGEDEAAVEPESHEVGELELDAATEADRGVGLAAREVGVERGDATGEHGVGLELAAGALVEHAAVQDVDVEVAE